MPSAASAKLEKQASSNQAETSDNNNVNTPIRQALVIIEHKIRNLEKRKTKLESYRAIQSTGKELSQDQKAAVAKYDEVAHSLEFARELSKQMLQIATVAEKDQKKQARKEALVRAQAETAKIREVLSIQNILTHFADSDVRDDFLNGCNGAAKLEENDLTILEKFYNDIQVKRQSQPEDIPFVVGAQKAAEYLSMTIDGRPKQYGETTFDNVRRILQTIQDCGYLDKAGKIEIVDEETKVEEEEDEEEQSQDQDPERVQGDQNVISGQEAAEISQDDGANANKQQIAQTHPIIGQVELPKFQPEAPAAAAVPTPTFPQTPQQPTLVNPQISSQAQLQRPLVPPAVATVAQGQVPQLATVPTAPAPATPLHAGHFPPTTVRAVEQAYFKQHQYIQQMRPLAEVIGSANFFFLQESELDSPDMVPSGFTPNEPQNPVPNIPTGTLAPQSPTAAGNLTAPPIVPQQITMVQPGIQGKTQQQPPPAPIPTQTFTNQSFPNIVPPPVVFPQTVQNPEIPSNQPQIPVFAATAIPIPQLVAQPAVASQSQTTVLSVVEPQPAGTIPHATQPINSGNLITGPSGANVPLPCFSKITIPTPPVGMQQAATQLQIKEQFEQIQTTKQAPNENTFHNPVEEPKERSTENSSDWDANENNQKSITSHPEEESNQWNNEVASNNKSSNEWNAGFDNQTESNTWSGNQNEGYSGGRSNPRSGFSGGINRAGGGSRGIRGGPAPNNYRGGRSNNYQQQNGRSAGMYFRNNNDSNYYQNQNGGYNNGKDPSGNFGGNSNNTFRLRGGPVPPNRQQGGGRMSGQSSSGANSTPRTNSNPNRNNMGISNPNNRPGRSNGGNAPNYGTPRPPTNVRQQQQDVNA